MIGRTLSHYRILKKLGAGGMGDVFLARDDRLGRKVALKLLPRIGVGPKAAQRFDREARAPRLPIATPLRLAPSCICRD